MFPKEVKQADITAKVIESEESDGDNDFAAEKNLAKELAGTWVVNDDLNFLTKKWGYFKGIAGGLIPPRRFD